MPASASPPPLDLDSQDAQQRLAHLEALLAGSLFDTAPSPAPNTASEPDQAPPTKRTKTSHSSPPPPTAPADAALQPQEAVAFRLFSSQKAPQRVVLREAETPPPFVVDRRIRDVDDELPETVQARRSAIAALAVDGETIRSQAQLPPVVAPPPHQLTHRALSSSSRFPSSIPLPRLAYLNARLPAPLAALSPHPVPFPEALEDQGLLPPATAHEGILAVAPLPGVYARVPRRRRFNGEGKEAHEFVPVEEGVRRGLPPRNPVLKVHGGGGGGAGEERRWALVVRAILGEEQPEAVSKARRVEAEAAREGKKGRRLSKARRARARKGASAA
ncbi:hypothetical protein JCM3775_001401 [Rhodotorula graminis]